MNALRPHAPWNLEELHRPPPAYPAPGFSAHGVTALFYAGEPFQGKETRVFAWIGIPEGASRPVPGMVLVHGGGGTAFADWMRLWMARGYAAIAMDLNGRIPVVEEHTMPNRPTNSPASPARRMNTATPSSAKVGG